MEYEKELVGHYLQEIKYISFYAKQIANIEKQIAELETESRDIQTPKSPTMRVGTSGHTADVKTRVNKIYSKQMDLKKDKQFFEHCLDRSKQNLEQLLDVCKDNDEKSFISDYAKGSSLAYLQNHYYTSNAYDKAKRIVKRVLRTRNYI